MAKRFYFTAENEDNEIWEHCGNIRGAKTIGKKLANEYKQTIYINDVDGEEIVEVIEPDEVVDIIEPDNISEEAEDSKEGDNELNEWHGNDEIFKGYIEGSSNGKGNFTLKKTTDKNNILTFNEAAKCSCYGAVLNDDIIDISFDNAEMGKKFLDMAKANNWRCLVLSNPKNDHIHTFWKNKRRRITKMSAKDVKLAVGFTADIHGGATYIPLRVHGVNRYPPIYDIQDGEDYQEVPEELLPVSTKIDLWGTGEGGRNDILSRMAKFLIHNENFSKEEIRRILNNTNDFVFDNPLSSREMNTILRDETFDGLHESHGLKVLNGVELFQLDVKPTEFIIEGLLPVGLMILASPPKYGKSWLCLDMALSVASGSDFLEFKTNKNGVLYLALEDRNDRLKERMIRLTGGQQFPILCHTAIESGTLDNGLLKDLGDYLYENSEIKLIIVDTFVKIRGEPKRNESAYALDSREAGVMKKFADDHQIAIVLVTHTRKNIDPDDPFMNVTGTYGVIGVADNMIVLTKQKRNDNVTKMSVTGRDVSYEEYPIVFDGEHGKWLRQSDSYDDFITKNEIATKRAAYMIGNIRKTIIKLLEENNGIWKGRCGDIIKKSEGYKTPINLSSKKLGEELAEINGFLFEDNISHIEIDKGTASKLHKFEKYNVP